MFVHFFRYVNWTLILKICSRKRFYFNFKLIELSSEEYIIKMHKYRTYYFKCTCQYVCHDYEGVIF